jgi:hypothetical protein
MFEAANRIERATPEIQVPSMVLKRLEKNVTAAIGRRTAPL